MTRKATDIAHVNLRINEDLRKALVDAANTHRRSLNEEIRMRLEKSFEQDTASERVTAAERATDVLRQGVCKAVQHLTAALVE